MDFYTDIDEQTLDLVKYPPVRPPEVYYNTDLELLTNNLRGSIYQFAYYYVYDDGEKSVLSPYSKIAIPQGEETLLGGYVSLKSINNKIGVKVSMEHFTIDKSVICVRLSGTGEWREFAEIKKAQDRKSGNVSFRRYLYSGFAMSEVDNPKLSGISPVRRFTFEIDNFQRGPTMDDLPVGGILKLTFSAFGIPYVLDGAIEKISGNTVTLMPVRFIADGQAYDPNNLPVGNNKIRIEGVYLTNSYISYFTNTEVFTTMNASRDRNFDYVPLKAGVMDLGEDDRVFLADVTEGFDNVETKLNVDYEVKDLNETSDLQKLPYINYFDIFPNAFGGRYFVVDQGATSDESLTIGGYYQYFDLNNDDYSVNRVYVFKIEYRSRFSYENTIFTQDFITVTEISKETDRFDFYDYFAQEIQKELYALTKDNSFGKKIKIYVRRSSNGRLIVYCEGNLSNDAFTLSLISYGGVNEKTPTIKENSSVNFGIVYYDRALRTNGVSGVVTLDIPSFTDRKTNPPDDDRTLIDGSYYKYRAYDFHHRITPIMEIANDAPDWAKYYQIVYGGTDRATKVVMAGIRLSDVERDGNYFQIPVNKVIDIYRENVKDTVISNYNFEEGDRIRIHGVILDPEGSVYDGISVNGRPVYSIVNPVYLYENIDEKISGVSYPDTDESYKRDASTDKDYVVDANGNKVRKDSFLSVEIQNFNLTESQELEGGNIIQRIEESSVLVFEIYRQKESSIDNIYSETGIVGEVYESDGRYLHRGIEDEDTDQAVLSPCRLNLDFYNSVNMARMSPYITEDDSVLDMPAFFNSDNVSDIYESKIFYGKNIPKLEVLNQRRRGETIRWGGQYVTNTEINNTNQFEFDGQIQLDSKDGVISGLRTIGYIMKAVQPNKVTSIYQGREVLTNADGSEDLKILKDSVVGTVYPSQTDYGSSIKGSILVNDGFLYFIDDIRTRICRASQSGVEPIDVGVRNFINGFKDVFRSNNKVVSVYDEKRMEVIFSIQSNSENHTFSFYEPSSTWKTFYSFLPEDAVSLGSYLFTLKDGVLWLHDDNELRNNFYGVQYDQEIEFAFNVDPNKMKVFNGVALNTNKLWGSNTIGDIYIPATDLYPQGMSSVLPSGRFKRLESTYVADYLRDANTPNRTESEAILNGRFLRGNSLVQKLSNSHTENVVLFNINLYITPSEIS